MCSNANPLHYYALRVLRKVDRWCWVWSIFNSRTTWADHITCGTSICIMYWRKLGWWWWKEGGRWNPVPAHSLLFSKSTKGAARLNVPHPTDESLWTVLYAFSTYILRKCTSPPLLAPRLKIFKLKFTTSPGIEPRTRWTRGRHATMWASTAGTPR